MSRGLVLARAHGADSLEELIERLLLETPLEASESAIGPRQQPPSTGGPLRARSGSSESTADRTVVLAGAGGDDRGFVVNPPALTLDQPHERLALELAAELPPSTLALPFLTNRLSPIKASVRALANLAARDGQWPRLRDFHAEAGHAARDWGLRLQAEDRAAGRRARLKRSVAWPIGANPATALERYVFAFTLAADGPIAVGPLATLGLATLIDGRAVLTSPGWELAAAISPVLDGGEGTLSTAEAEIFRHRLLEAPPERAAISEFLGAVRRAAGAQPRIDELLATWRTDWSADQAAAQRSAMIGRLEELGVLDVTGRGSKAIVSLGDVEDFEQDATERSAA